MTSDELKKLLDDYQNKPTTVSEFTPQNEQDYQSLINKVKDISSRPLITNSQVETVPQIEEPKQVDIPQVPIKPLDLTDKALNDAIQKRNQNQNLALLHQGFNKIAEGISGVKPAGIVPDYYNKIAGQGIEDLKLGRDQQKVLLDLYNKKQLSDPASSISKAARDFATKIGVQLPVDVSYEVVDDLLKKTQHYKEFQENVAARKDIMKLKSEELGLARESKQEAKDSDRLDKMSKLIESSIASSRSSFGQAARNLQSIQAAKQLLTGRANLDDIDNREITEVARTLDRILSGGTPTISGTEKLTPATARSFLAKKLEFISSDPQGAGLGKFVQRYQKTLDREENLARSQIASTQKSLLSSYKDLQKKHPERFNEILEQKGIPADIMSPAKPPKIEMKMIRMVAPDGTIRLIPENKVNSALKAGGKMAE